jgi:plasmid stability protein
MLSMSASRRRAASAAAAKPIPKERTAKHLTVRNVPEDVARALAAERRRSGESLNKTIIELLRRALDMNRLAPDNGLGALAGTWSAEDLAEFEEATRCFETIDEDLWR